MVLILISFRVKYISHSALKLLRLLRRVRFFCVLTVLCDGYSWAAIVVGIVLQSFWLLWSCCCHFCHSFCFCWRKKRRSTHTHMRWKRLTKTHETTDKSRTEKHLALRANQKICFNWIVNLTVIEFSHIDWVIVLVCVLSRARSGKVWIISSSFLLRFLAPALVLVFSFSPSLSLSLLFHIYLKLSFFCLLISSIFPFWLLCGFFMII